MNCFVLGWTGHVSTSWKIKPNSQTTENIDLSEKTYDGQSSVLYWADAYSEIAFVVPSGTKHTSYNSENQQHNFNTSSLSCKLHN